MDVPFDRFYPVEATLVPVAERTRLQDRLNTHGIIRLEAADYRQGNTLTGLTLRANQRIYGLSRSIVPDITVTPGCSGAVVSGVVANLRFPSSAQVTRNNLFSRVTYGSGSVVGASLRGNLFLDLAYYSWSINTSSQGFLQNNRFIRQVYHATGDAFVWNARAAAPTPTSGNVMLWANFLTPPLRKFDLTNLDDLAILNYDCEVPGSNGSPGIKATGCGRLTVFSTTGTNSRGPAIDAGARQIWVHGSHLYNQTTGDPTTIIRSDNRAAVQTKFDDTRIHSYAGIGTMMQAIEEQTDASATVMIAGVNPALGATSQQSAAILDVVARSPTPTAWEVPSYRPAPTIPATLIRRSLGRSGIQAMLNAQGVVVLPAGVYTLDGPLVLGEGKGLVGSGMDSTFLVAANATIDLITDDGTSHLVLADLTLQGGRNGIFHTYTSGPIMQFTNTVVSHVCIRDMAGSGWLFTDIFGYDNNFFDYVIFANCATGFRQLATQPGTESNPRINYMDKNVFYHCQWLGCGKALDLVGFRASGGNAWINCRFQDSTQYVSRAINHNPMLFANCDFSNNVGNPVVNTNGNLFLTACRFVAGAANPVDLADAISVTLEGCSLALGGASRTVVSSGNPTWFDVRNPANLVSYTNRRIHLFNNTSTDVPLGKFQTALAINNNFPKDQSLSGRLIWSRQGILTQADTGAATPGTRILVGEAFPPAIASHFPPNTTVSGWGGTIPDPVLVNSRPPNSNGAATEGGGCGKGSGLAGLSFLCLWVMLFRPLRRQG